MTLALAARYKGTIKSYHEGDFPKMEKFQKHICLFKTGMQTLKKTEREVNALEKTIAHFNNM